MIQRTEIPPPLRGVSDRWAAQYQEPFTLPGALNMRPLDPISGRNRLSQRSGSTKFVEASLGASFVQDLISINKDVRLATYTARTSGPGVEWSKVTPSDSRVRDVQITPGGDIWVISGPNRLAKYNSSGSKVLEVQLALTFANEFAKCLALGSDGAVFVSTQTGVDRFSGKVYRYEADPLNAEELVLIWTYDAKARVPSIAHNSGVLYLIANKSETTELRALTQLSTDVPLVLWTKSVPNPSAQVTVNDSGEILVASEPRDGRDDVVLGAFCGTKTVDWTPFELGSSVRSWHDAQTLAEFFDNDVVDFWFDYSGNSRNLRAAGQGESPRIDSAATYGGKYVSNGVCGMAAVRFDGTPNADGLYPGMTSDPGAGSPIPPGNTPSFLSMLFKVRNPGADPDVLTDYGKIVERGGQPYFTVWQSSSGRFVHGEFSDPIPTDDQSGGPGDTDPGRVGGISIANDGDICILTIAFDPQGDTEGSFFRVNGFMGGAYTPDGQFTLGDFRMEDALRVAYSVWGEQSANMDLCEMISIEGEYQNPLTYEPYSGGSSGVSGNSAGSGDSEIEKIEGYLAHKYGVQSVLNAGHPYAATAPTAASGGSSGSSSGGDSTSYVDVLRSPYGIVSKYAAAAGTLRWAVAGPGLGFSVVTDDDDGVYCAGPMVTPVSGGSSGASGALGPPDTVTVRKIVDEGSSVSEDESSGAGSWSWSGDNPQIKGARLAVDSEKNLYVPTFDQDAVPTLVKFTADGAVEWFWNSTDGVTLGYAAAIDTIATDFGDDTIGEPEFLYLGTGLENDNHGLHTLYKLRLVDVSVAVGAPRENQHLGVCEGNIRRMIPGGVPSVVTVTGGAGALNAGSRIVSSIYSQGKAYFIDGENAKVYDPDTGEVIDWQSKGAGTLPKRPRIMVEWRSRVVLARSEGKPFNITMSEVGNPEGWDLYPATPTATMAVSFELPSTTDTGRVPDVVNSLIPYSDDQLIIGGDHSIHVLVGDPTGGVLDPARGTFQAGQIQLISDSIGMAFGRPWCKDPSGAVYFFGSRGGIYRMVPGSSPQRISDDIDKRIDELDLNYFTVRMVWNERDQGLHVFTVPIDVVPAASGGSSGSSAPVSGGSSGASSGPVSGGSSSPASGGSSGVVSGGSSGSPSGGSSGTPSGGSSGSPSGGPSGGPSSEPSGLTSGPGGPSAGPGGSVGPDPVGTNETPQGQAAVGDPIMHWFWYRGSGPEQSGWWPDRFPVAGMDPTSVTVADGDDPDDRVILIGGADGYVRFWDGSAKNDDDQAIEAHATLGPIMPKSVQQRVRFSGFRVALASDQDGAVLRLFATDSTDDLGIANPDAFVLEAGDNRAWRKRVRGKAVFMQIYNTAINERFSVESMGVEYTPGGRVR